MRSLWVSGLEDLQTCSCSPTKTTTSAGAVVVLRGVVGEKSDKEFALNRDVIKYLAETSTRVMMMMNERLKVGRQSVCTT